ncbi:hypothetical protein R69927_05447 [Paraburkholderia domus]|uniref:Glutathionylspermidine synthase pre-ATP-grasp-like domain-containing protein n=2 Tax=Paraburkholderia domus TaxID=2793075 RepID=A0A9N8QUF5_9BURK|nr:hypothetical protein [Paraburkholderia domus]MBK5051498.1 hypothetical protein [Burkholderia sp. R-70006]MBK5063649.1 hypothetical protein [Burkholderia sp. R-70199]MBK5089670.1 hypothetical protein [Burkholderia sp. R-69927]MBK5122865.1 hypothetical protein [Burkholderia sp. R-69980]MBK5165267.1 hypothetical protein [Burkholderia sp. R-70211]MCI0148977.1 hypothetical protein [Paraburkholderia sediminicola]MDR3414121.1 hypothetical protein [Formivibrio sp.]MDR3738312.1 hypothetical prote
MNSSDVCDLPIFDPDKDWITLEKNHSNAEFNQAYSHVQRRTADDNLAMSFEGNQSRPYPVMSGVCALHAEAQAILEKRVTIVYGALQKIVAAYRADANLQAFLDIPGPLKQWVREDAHPANNNVDLCRFDLMGRTLSELKIIEFNCNAPGGIVYAGLINRYWREAPFTSELIGSWGGASSTFEREDWVATWLSKLARQRGMCDVKGIGLLHPEGGNILELPHLKKRLEAIGLHSVMLTPEQINQSDEQSFQLAYLKYGVQRAIQDVPQWNQFCRSIVEGRLVVQSSLAGRWIGDNKLCVAVMSDPRFSYLFDDTDRAAIGTIIPMSWKLGDGITQRDVIDDKDDFVIKHPYGTRGASVHVGRDYDDRAWRQLINKTSSLGYVVQQYVESDFEIDGESCFRDLVVMIASGAIVGYGSRVSRARKVNIAQDGRKMAVLSSLGATHS